MKFLILFLFFYPQIFCVSFDFLLSQALKDSIHELFIKKSLKFDLILISKTSKLIEKILNEIPKNLTEKVIRVRSGGFNLAQPALILSKSFKDATNFMFKSKSINKYPKNIKFLFFIEDFQFKLPRGIIQWNFDSILYFSYFLINTKREISLVSLEWFTELGCNKQQIKFLNILVKKSKKWQKLMKVEEKFQTFHNCQINFYINNDGNEFHTQFDEKIWKSVGLMPDLLEVVAEKGKKLFKNLNFI